MSQWVLSLPHRLRYRLAGDHDLCRAVVGRTMRAILGFLRRRARDAGVQDGRSGAVAIVQRFGGAVNLNIHIHALVVDGVFGHDATGLRFYPAAALDAADVDEVLATVEAYLQRLLPPQGLEETDAGGSTVDEWAEEAPVLAGLAAASVQGRVALGSRAGARVRRGGASLAAVTDPPGLGPCQARHNGFDLHAALCVPAGQRDRLERVCRYALRPPIAQDRLELTAEQVQLQLRRPWSDGTTHLLFDPRGTARAPRHADTAAARRILVGADGFPESDHVGPPRRARGQHAIEDPAVIERILRHLGLPTDIPEARPARPPPMPFLLDGLATAGGDDQILVDTRS